MRVDVHALETFNRLAHEGATEATSSMAAMTGIDATVDVTKISLIDRADVGDELGSKSYAGVQFDFDGALSGETVLVFERSQTDEIVESMMPGASADESMAQSAIEEIGNIMMSGFIDGWAEYLGASIEHTPPGYIEGTSRDVLPEETTATGVREQVFVFRSEIEWEGESVNFFIYMLPEYDSIATLLGEHAGEADDAIPIDKLAVFNQMTQRGTAKAAANVAQMSGIETDAEVTQISFVPIEDVPKQFSDETYVGTAVEFTGAPSGFLLVLFDEQSAITVAEALMPVEVDSPGLTEQHKLAIEELGNIMTSGFVDGWANVLEQTVDHTPPRLVHDMGRAIIDPLAAQLGQHQQHAFVIDSVMRTEELEFTSEIHALPNESELRSALEDLDVERAEETDADTEQIF